jgi:hypothetical protein
MRAIDGYSGYPVTALALKLAPLVYLFARANCARPNGRSLTCRMRNGASLLSA